MLNHTSLYIYISADIHSYIHSHQGSRVTPIPLGSYLYAYITDQSGCLLHPP